MPWNLKMEPKYKENFHSIAFEIPTHSPQKTLNFALGVELHRLQFDFIMLGLGAILIL